MLAYWNFENFDSDNWDIFRKHLSWIPLPGGQVGSLGVRNVTGMPICYETIRPKEKNKTTSWQWVQIASRHFSTHLW